MVKLAKKSLDRLLLSEYFGDYEKRGTKLKLRTSLTLRPFLLAKVGEVPNV
jgi:hypothetical protein